VSTQPWYEEYFRSDYFRFWLGGDETPTIRREQTEREAAFVQEKLALPPAASLLDLCCGHGRHAIALAGAGYRVTGLDLSTLHLQIARQRAEEAQVEVEWLRGDMRRLPFREDRFDAVINMFISFGYLESDAEDQQVLHGISRVLKPGGRFLLDYINRDAALRHLKESSSVELNGTTLVFNQRFDPVSGRTSEERIAIERDGTRHVSHVSLRYYSLDELIAMLSKAGMRFVQAWGDLDGGPPSLESQRLILLAEKPRTHEG
jgi:ubiquinone/menaquinone biosynthesis C-methylase UbiE